MKKLLSLLLIAICNISYGEEGVKAIDKFLGLHDNDSPALISDYESQDCLNVESNLTGTALLKRRGYERIADFSAASAINGSYNFIASNGDKIVIVCYSKYCYKSTNDSAFSLFLTTNTTTITRWSFASVNSKLYLLNDARDYFSTYDGSTLTLDTSAPRGSIMELTESRLIIADTSANPNRIYYSQAGNYTNFTVGTEDVDSWYDDIGSPGDRTTALKYWNSRLYIFKKNSITQCVLDNQYNSQCFLLSSNIGTSDPNSIVMATDGIYFHSSDFSKMKIDNTGLSKISQKITSFSNNLLTGSIRNNTQNTKSDWDNGTQTPSNSWNTASEVGSIYPTTWTVVDTSSSNFASGTLTYVSTEILNGSIILPKTYIYDDWSDGDYTSSQTWTAKSGTWGVTSGKELYSQSGIIYTSINYINSLSFSDKYTQNFIYSINFKLYNYSSGASHSAYIYLSTSTSSYAYNIYIANICDPLLGNIGLVYASTTSAFTPSCNGNWHNFKIIKSTYTNRWNFYLDNSIIASNVYNAQDIKNIMLQASATSGKYVYFDTMTYISNYSTGSFTSQIFNTGFSTSTSGPIYITSSVATGTQIDLFTRQSSSTAGVWSDWTATSDTLKTSTTQQYWQYKTNFYNTNLTSGYSKIDDVTLNAATTGQFASQCIQVGSGISSWGMINCSDTQSNGGGITYYMRSSNTCSGLTSQSWTSQTNNATIGISTNAATQIRFDSSLVSSTSTAKVDSCTIYWNNGTVAQPIWGVYDTLNNNIYWTQTTTASTTSDRLLKYDLDLQQFYPYDIKATALSYIDNSLYFGSSDNAYWNKYGNVDTDNGSAISSYWKSKDFYGVDPFRETTWQKISLITKNIVTGDMTSAYKLSNGTSGSYNISLSTTSGIEYVRSNYAIPYATPSNFFNIKFSNNETNQRFEVMGLKLDYFTQPWRVINP